MSIDQLKRIADSIAPLRGWDFSRMRDNRDPVPWDYVEVVRRYLRPTDRVLDVGTGGGEVFLSLAPHLRFGVGVDLYGEVVRVARENTPAELAGRILFLQSDASALAFPAGSFDVVLNRHAGVFPDQVVQVLRPGGYFITQQVGGRNSQNLFDAFDWGSNGAYWRACWEEWGVPLQDVDSLAEAFRAADCRVIATAEYDVPYYFLDLESFIFWLKAVPLPEPFDLERWGPTLARFLDRHTTPLGIETNEHRELLVVRKLRAL